LGTSSFAICCDLCDLLADFSKNMLKHGNIVLMYDHNVTLVHWDHTA
jgi:hypothetical protein